MYEPARKGRFIIKLLAALIVVGVTLTVVHADTCVPNDPICAELASASSVKLLGCDPNASDFDVPASWKAKDDSNPQTTSLLGDTSGLSCRYIYGRADFKDFASELKKSVTTHFTAQWRNNFQGARIDYLSGEQPALQGQVCLKEEGKHNHQHHFRYNEGGLKPNQKVTDGYKGNDCGHFCAFAFHRELDDGGWLEPDNNGDAKACQLEQSLFRGYFVQAQAYHEANVLKNIESGEVELVDFDGVRPCSVNAVDAVKATREVASAMKTYYRKFALPTFGHEGELKAKGADPDAWKTTLDFCAYQIQCLGALAEKNKERPLCKLGISRSWNQVKNWDPARAPLSSPPKDAPLASTGVCSVMMAQELLRSLWESVVTCEIDSRTQKEFLQMDASKLNQMAFERTQRNSDSAPDDQGNEVLRAVRDAINPDLARDCVAHNWNEINSDEIADAGHKFSDGGHRVDRSHAYNWKHASNGTLNYNWAYQENMNKMFDAMYAKRKIASQDNPARTSTNINPGVVDRIKAFDASGDELDLRLKAMLSKGIPQ